MHAWLALNLLFEQGRLKALDSLLSTFQMAGFQIWASGNRQNSTTNVSLRLFWKGCLRFCLRLAFVFYIFNPVVNFVSSMAQRFYLIWCFNKTFNPVTIRRPTSQTPWTRQQHPYMWLSFHGNPWNPFYVTHEASMSFLLSSEELREKKPPAYLPRLDSYSPQETCREDYDSEARKEAGPKCRSSPGAAPKLHP